MLRTITHDEVYQLKPLLTALAAYHNEVSVNFKGFYPNRPIGQTLAAFDKGLRDGTAACAVIEEDNAIVGFCKVDLHGDRGKLDYLIVGESCRGRGFGKELMDWAMQTFADAGIRQVEVKVVDGNKSAIRLYERYGFRMNAHILLREE